MNHVANSLTRPLLNTTGAASATNWAPVDTIGFDYLSFDVSVVQATAAETSVEAIRISEIIPTTTVSVISDFSAYTTVGAVPITQCVGAAAVSTSAAFVLPVRSSTTPNNYRFNIDLRGRKRFIGVEFIPVIPTTTGGVCINAILSRAGGSDQIVKDVTTTVGATRLIVDV